MGESVIRGGYGVVVAQDPVEVSGRVQIPLATPDDGLSELALLGTQRRGIEPLFWLGWWLEIELGVIKKSVRPTNLRGLLTLQIKKRSPEDSALRTHCRIIL